MQINRNKLLVWGACWLISSLPGFAVSSALIVIGTTGDPAITGNLNGVAATIQAGLIQRGFAPDAIEILKATSPEDRVTADRVLASLKKQEKLTATDELWVVLLGFGGRTDEGAPTFQTSGPRLSAAALKTELEAIPARQNIFVGTSDSGGFVPALLAKNRNVLAATRQEGEIDLPRFPEAWAAALKEKPDAGWNALAARAAVINDKTYADNNLAVGEHARMGDPETGRILEAPFGIDKVAAVDAKPESDGRMALINASDIKVEIHQPNSEWEKQPATAETKKMMADAKAVPNPEGFSAIMLQQGLGYKVGEDRMAEEFTLERIYVTREDGVARWANYLLPQNPPAITTKLEAARIIQPDGSSTVFNPAKMPVATDCSSGLCGALTTVFMPDAHAGCLIEIAYRTRHILDATQPDFSEELTVQRDIPVLKTELQLQIPEKSTFHYKLRNNDEKPIEAVANGMKLLSWKLGELAAFESLPFDPPVRDLLVTLDVSSLPSWDAFAAWYRRLARGSDAQDDAVKAKAQELAAGATTRTDKIRRAYEFVSALRYVAIEFGINGLRPRTPALVLQNRYGDCKDKANLLIALLADMGIEGKFSVLNRGSSTDVSFPSWQFNHAIAYVPKAPEAGQPEDLWLDTTDSTAPFPTLSPGDIGCAALVFSKEKAEFLTVASTGKEVTDLKETWKLQQKPDGTWSGTLQSAWSGLAEYEMRSSVRGLTPRQRDFTLQTALGRQLDDADFSQINLTAADDLSIPLTLQAQVDVASQPNPLPAFASRTYFAPPARNRPLQINEGQKLHLTQALDLTYDHGAPETAPANFEEKAGGLEAKITWEKVGNQVLRRTTELDVANPIVAQADYAPVRKMLRSWTEHLNP